MADPALLTTYEAERKPVAEYNTAQAVHNFRSIVGSSDTGPRAFRPENFVHPGLDIGFRYDQGAVDSKGSTDASWPVGEFVPGAVVGERAPHVWLDAERTLSTLDLFGRELVILARVGSTPAFETDRRAEAWGIPHQSISFGPGGTFVAPEPEWAATYQVADDEAILVRPDGHVLARITASTTQAVDRVLAIYTGRRKILQEPADREKTSSSDGSPTR